MVCFVHQNEKLLNFLFLGPRVHFHFFIFWERVVCACVCVQLAPPFCIKTHFFPFFLPPPSSSFLNAFSFLFISLQSLISELLDSVYRHRYRDTNTDIRVSTASAMGTWIQTNPKLFCQDQFLRYFAWMMTDRNALVRKETLKGIKILFQAQNGPYLNQKFTTKFVPRFVEMTQDVRKKKK